MKNKKIIGMFSLVVFYSILSFIIGTNFPVKINSIDDILDISIDDFQFLKPSFATIKICNNTKITLGSVHFRNEYFTSNVLPGECTKSSKIDNLYSLVSPTIFTKENGIKYSYSVTYLDSHGIKKYMLGDYILNIDELTKNDSGKFVEYYDGLSYELNKIQKNKE